MIRWHAPAPAFAAILEARIRRDRILIDGAEVPVDDARDLVRVGLCADAAWHKGAMTGQVSLAALIAANRSRELAAVAAAVDAEFARGMAAWLAGDAATARRRIVSDAIPVPRASTAAALAAWFREPALARNVAEASALPWTPMYFFTADGDAARVLALQLSDRAAAVRFLAACLQARTFENPLVQIADAAHALGEDDLARRALEKAGRRAAPAASLARFSLFGDVASARRGLAVAAARARLTADWSQIAACWSLMPEGDRDRERSLVQAERAADTATDFWHLARQTDGARNRRALKGWERRASGAADFAALAQAGGRKAPLLRKATLAAASAEDLIGLGLLKDAESRVSDAAERVLVADAWEQAGDPARARALREQAESAAVSEVGWRAVADSWTRAKNGAAGIERCHRKMTDRMSAARMLYASGDDDGFRRTLAEAEAAATTRSDLAMAALLWMWAAGDEAAARRCIEKASPIEPDLGIEFPSIVNVCAAIGEVGKARTLLDAPRSQFQGTPSTAERLLLGDAARARQELEKTSAAGANATGLLNCALDWVLYFEDDDRARALTKAAEKHAKDVYEIMACADGWTAIGDGERAGSLLDRAARAIKDADGIASLAERERALRGPGPRVTTLRRRYLKAAKDWNSLITASEMAYASLGDRALSKKLLVRAEKAAASAWDRLSCALVWQQRFADPRRARRVIDTAVRDDLPSTEAATLATEYVRRFGDRAKAKRILKRALATATEEFDRQAVTDVWRSLFAEPPPG